MPILIGSHVRSGDRQGEVINYHAHGYTVRDDETGRFFVAPKKNARKTRKKARYPAGTRVWLRVKDVDKPVLAVAIGAGQYRGIEDMVWANCILDDREAKVIGEAT
jgi:hypothetical protein